MRIDKRQHLLIETRGRARDRYTISGQTLNPIIECGGGDRERDIHNLTCPSVPFGCIRPGKERDDGAGCSNFIAIIEMIGAGIIKVDGLLDEALSQNTGIKIDILLGVSHDSGEMVKTSK